MKNDNHWVTISASIRIIADSIDLCQLEKILGMHHTSFLTRGSRRGNLLYKGTRDIWVTRLTKVEFGELEKLLLEIHNTLSPRLEALASIRDQLHYDTELYISYHSDLANGGFQLPVNLITLLAQSKLSINLSIFSWGKFPEETIDDAGKDNGK